MGTNTDKARAGERGDKAKERTLSKYGEAMKSSLGFHRTPGTPAGLAPPTGSVGARMAGVVNDREAAIIEVARIVPDPEQPRRAFDEEALDRLAESLKGRGQLQNIVVFWSEDLSSYVLVSGERRWRAARRGGLATLRCKVLAKRPEDSDRLAIQLVENCVREDLLPVEQASAFRALMESNGWSTRQVAEALNMAQAKVVYALGLLELPDDLKGRVDRGELAPRTAYEIGRLETPEEQVALADRVAAEGLTRDDVVAEVRSADVPGKGKARGPGKGAPAAGPNAKGRGGPRLPTSKSFRFPGGRVTIEKAKGVDADAYRAAALLLLEQADRLDAPNAGDSQAGADLGAEAGADPGLAA